LTSAGFSLSSNPRRALLRGRGAGGQRGERGGNDDDSCEALHDGSSLLDVEPPRYCHWSIPEA
jgi:hypothetical protein